MGRHSFHGRSILWEGISWEGHFMGGHSFHGRGILWEGIL